MANIVQSIIAADDGDLKSALLGGILTICDGLMGGDGDEMTTVSGSGF